MEPESWQVGRFLFTLIPPLSQSTSRVAGYTQEELGMDHFEVRGWRCIHRHYYVTALSYLLCSRTRQSLDQDHAEALTVEQVRRSLNVYLAHHHLPPDLRAAAFEKELADQQYYQARSAQAKTSHTKTRIKFYLERGIDVDKIKSCLA